jgi:hypothetical protein
MRFYSYNPLINYPFVLRKITKPSVKCKHEIVDIGIYDLLKYGKHPKWKIDMWLECEPNGWKVVPDYPDTKGEFGYELSYDNVEMTFKNLHKYYNPEQKKLLPVIQSKFEDVRGFKENVKYFEEEFGIPKQVGVGSVCKIKRHQPGIQMLKFLRERWPETYIHAFGLRFNLLKKTYQFIDSYDTMSWTLQRCPPNNKPRTANTNKERIAFFNHYLKKIEKNVDYLELQ